VDQRGSGWTRRTRGTITPLGGPGGGLHFADTTAEQGGATSSETTPLLNPEPMRKIIGSLSGGSRNPKAQEPEVYRGERHKLRGWLAQLIVY